MTLTNETNKHRLSMRLAGGALAAVAALTLGACSTDTSSSTTPVESTTEQGGVVDAQQFADVVETPGVVTVDVRTPAEYSQGHIEGAVNINLESPDFATEIGQLDPNTTYAVYCRSGNRSATAVAEMSDAGFTSLYDLGGGIGAWQSAGLPVVQ